MAVISRHPAGTVCWLELATSDRQGAETFYSALFDWQVFHTPAGSDASVAFRLRGHDAATLYQLRTHEAGVAPHWKLSFATENAERTTSRAAALGAQILLPPFAVATSGHMAMLKDPSGGEFSLWQPGLHSGLGITREPGALWWCELITPSPDVCAKFYMQLFGWERRAVPTALGDYTIFEQNGASVAGMVRRAPGRESAGAEWRVYFAAADAAAAAERAVALGGRVRAAAFDAPGIGRIASLEDPQGAPFAVVTPEAGAR